MIVISAGHHKDAKGAEYEGFIEHDEAVLWASLIHKLLFDRSIMVPFGVVKDKVDFINSKKNVVLAVEIHINTDLDRKGNGCETLYNPLDEKSKQAAKLVQDSIKDIFPPDRGSRAGYYQSNKAKGLDFFLERTNCPAVIIMPEFIHHPVKISTNRKRACEALAAALLKLSYEL